MKPSRWSHCKIAALIVAASVALSGCGILGCAGGRAVGRGAAEIGRAHD